MPTKFQVFCLIFCVPHLAQVIADDFENLDNGIASPRSVAELHQDLRTLESATAKLKGDKERAKNIADLCHLFVELGQHPELGKSPTLQSLSVRLHTRLRGIERRTIKELKRRKIEEPEAMQQERRQENQQRAFAHAGYRWQADMSSRHEPGNGEKAGANRRTQAGGNAAPGPDYGWVLVDLIRKTIRPEYWSVAGGPGKAIYYGNARALVIHGSWRVQEDVADLLTALRGGS